MKDELNEINELYELIRKFAASGNQEDMERVIQLRMREDDMDHEGKADCQSIRDLAREWHKTYSMSIDQVLLKAWEMGFNAAAKISTDYLEELIDKNKIISKLSE